MRAGFSEVDITPPLGCRKIGWLKEIIADRVHDPLFARIAVFESGTERIAFVQSDTLCTTASLTAEIRRRIEAAHGFPGARVMVSATHNHAGPAVTACGDVERDDAYIAALVAKLTEAFGRALSQRREAEAGVRTSFEFRIAHNRRVLMRDGTARTHGRFSDPGALCLEGPIDPELTVVAVRARGGPVLGALVNYACHPTHFGGDTTLSAGFPGVLARRMKEHGCPVTLYLNGACGNLHTSDPAADGADMSMDEAGGILAEHARQALAGTNWRGDVRLSATAKSVALPFREVSEAQIRGTVRGAQRFIDPAIYDRGMERLVRKIRERGTQDAEVQALGLDEYAFVAIPAEFFVQLGLKIKLRAHPRHALVVSCANGMVGYVPHAEAFQHGGYETTFGEGSFLAPQAGDLLVDAAAELAAAR